LRGLPWRGLRLADAAYVILAGQPDDYVQRQVVDFRRGARKSEVMRPIARALDNEQIHNLGAYYALLLPASQRLCESRRDGAGRREGRGIPSFHRCTSCHGEGFVGFGARLDDQREDVLVKALRDFKSGLPALLQ
jgi:cytochrome c553